MTNQQSETMSYLNQASCLNKRINALITEKQANISLATRCTANYDNTGGSNPNRNNGIETLLVRIAEQEREITEEIDKLVDARAEISKVIKTVGNMDQRTILGYRYLCYKSMGWIAEVTHCDKRTVQRKHKKAISKLSLFVTP